MNSVNREICKKNMAVFDNLLGLCKKIEKLQNSNVNMDMDS